MIREWRREIGGGRGFLYLHFAFTWPRRGSTRDPYHPVQSCQATEAREIAAPPFIGKLKFAYQLTPERFGFSTPSSIRLDKAENVGELHPRA